MTEKPTLSLMVSTKSNLLFSSCFVHAGVDCYLFSVEQKNVTQGFMMLLSDDGGRYMASEKQVSSNLRSSVLKTKKKQKPVSPGWIPARMWSDVSANTGASPVQVVDVVERGRLCEAHPRLPDVFAAVDGVHALHRILPNG